MSSKMGQLWSHTNPEDLCPQLIGRFEVARCTISDADLIGSWISFPSKSPIKHYPESGRNKVKGHPKFCALSFLLLLVLNCCTVIAQTGARSFIDSQIVGSTGGIGTQSSLALDSKGNPHISYTYSDVAETNLMYASYTGSMFIIQTVDANGAANPSIAMDSQDKPHIAYTCTNVTGSYLLYASYADQKWKIENIRFAHNGSSISHPSLKLDTDGFPHLAYVGPDEILEYAFWTGSAWKTEIIDPWTEKAVAPSLALGADGNPWISYFDPMIGLKCVSWTGSGWNKMIADSSQGVGKESSLALDPHGNPHISYDDDLNGGLKYASWTGSLWIIQVVDKNKHVSLHSSLAMDSRGYPHISYEDNANGNLVYATSIGSTWNLQAVDQIRVAPGDLKVVWGFPTSIALDSTGTAHISYCGYTRHDLKYASISDLPSFLVTFKLEGVEGFEGNVLEVDSVEFAARDLPKSFVWRAESNHSFGFASPLNFASGNKLMWRSTSGLSTLQDGELTVTEEGTLLATYEALTKPSLKQDIPLTFVATLLIAAVATVSVITFFVKRTKKLKKTP